MPTYVYRRPDGTTFEAFQKISADALTEDPETGVPVMRVISGGAGLQFKGDGFYITDYVKKSGAKDDGESSKTETKTEKPKVKKTEAAPATKSGSTATSSSSGSAASSSDS